MAIWPPKVANKLFSWELLHQVATCHFHTCVYRRRGFYRIFNALVLPITVVHTPTRFHENRSKLLA